MIVGCFKVINFRSLYNLCKTFKVSVYFAAYAIIFYIDNTYIKTEEQNY